MLISIVTDDAALEKVMLGPNGALAGLHVEALEVVAFICKKGAQKL